jgi:hypothetical protein
MQSMLISMIRLVYGGDSRGASRYHRASVAERTLPPCAPPYASTVIDPIRGAPPWEPPPRARHIAQHTQYDSVWRTCKARPCFFMARGLQ